MEGAFYNTGNRVTHPEHVAGSFSVEDVSDGRKFYGGFGAGTGVTGSFEKDIHGSTTIVRSIDENGNLERYEAKVKGESNINIDSSGSPYTSGDSTTSAGQIDSNVVSASGGTITGDNYVNYGYWARTRKPQQSSDYLERRAQGFHHGQKPSGDVSGVTGTATYKGGATGVTHYTKTAKAQTKFSGDLSLTAKFDTNEVDGTINNLTGDGMNKSSEFTIDAALDSSAGTFAGTTIFQDSKNTNSQGSNGSAEGSFYNTDSTLNIPGHVAGNFMVDMESDERIFYGAFGGAVDNAAKKARATSLYGDVKDVSITRAAGDSFIPESAIRGRQYTANDGGLSYHVTPNGGSVSSSGSADTESGVITDQMKYASGVSTENGKHVFNVDNFVNYGFWARTRKPHANLSAYERHVGTFYDGGSPSGDVSTVTGTAIYTGNAVGATHYKDVQKAHTTFSGDLNLTAKFDTNEVDGSISKLKGAGMHADSKFTIDASLSDSAGTFSGGISFTDGSASSNTDGNVEGSFYNTDSGINLPQHVAGSFDVTDTSDGRMFYGAFGGAADDASKKSQGQRIYGKVKDVSITEEANAKGTIYLAKPEGSADSYFVDSSTSSSLNADTATGKVNFSLQNPDGIVSANDNYVSYGYWARTRKPDANIPGYERHVGTFYDGGSPSGDVSTVTGSATYAGSAVGAVHYKDVGKAHTTFSGDLSLTAKFDTNEVDGTISKLTGTGMKDTSKFTIDAALDDSAGTFSGGISFADGTASSNTDGNVEGSFYNTDSTLNLPEHVAGSFDVTDTSDGRMFYGAFGGAADDASKKVQGQSLYGDVKDVSVTRFPGNEITPESSIRGRYYSANDGVVSYDVTPNGGLVSSSGSADTEGGKITEQMKYVDSGAFNVDNFVTYGFWARTRKPHANLPYRERHATGFYDGGSPVSDVSAVTGSAVYNGSASGVTFYEDTATEHTTWSGVSEIVTDFDNNTVKGLIDDVVGENMNDSTFKFYAELNDDGTFSETGKRGQDEGTRYGTFYIPGGGQVFLRQEYGTVEGGFYNHDTNLNLPGHVAGSFSTYHTIKGRRIYGAFGAAVDNASKKTRGQSLYADVKDVSITEDANAKGTTYLAKPEGSADSSFISKSFTPGGSADTAAGKEDFDLQNPEGALSATDNYVSYGYWARTRKPDASIPGYERHASGFYGGGSSAGDVSTVTGSATYAGSAVGATHYEDVEKVHTTFSGDLSLTANFDSNKVNGTINNLQGDGMNDKSAFTIDASLSDSAGTFSGGISFADGSTTSRTNGSVEGSFYNQNRSYLPPEHVAGSFEVDDVRDGRMFYGAFGGAETEASKNSYALQRKYGDIEKVNVTAEGAYGLFAPNGYGFLVENPNPSTFVERIKDQESFDLGYRGTNFAEGHVSTPSVYYNTGGRTDVTAGYAELAHPQRGSSYLTYGVWSNVQQVSPYYRRRVGSFYYGDNKTSNVGNVTGTASYNGEAVGFTHYHDPTSSVAEQFEGRVNMTADFNQDKFNAFVTAGPDNYVRYSGDINDNASFSGNLTHQQGSISIPSMVGGQATRDIEGSMSGHFYNQPQSGYAPHRAGGEFSFSTDDRTVTGAFGIHLGNRSQAEWAVEHEDAEGNCDGQCD